MSGECEECSKKKRLGLQTKLKINKPGDSYEREADRIADQVMAAPAHPAVSGAPPRIQRFAGKPTGQADAAPASVDHALASPGRPLEPALRQNMEQRFGYDFSRVRVHSGAAAEQSARDVNAYAYTVGHDMVFGAGRFTPGTHEGQRLIAHELTHVVQQSSADGIRAGQSDEKRGLPPNSDPYARGADIVYGAGELQGVNRLTAHELAHVDQSRLAAEPNVIRRAPGDGPGRAGKDPKKDPKIVSDVWKVEGRSVVVVESGGERTAFYQRSSSDLKGRLEGHAGPQKNDWAPFDGFKDNGRGGGHIQKDIYYAGKLASDPRYGYGSAEHLQTAIWLNRQILPEGIPEHWTYVQSRLQSKGVEVRTPLPTPIPERPAPVSPPARMAEGEINVRGPSLPGGGGASKAVTTASSEVTVPKPSVHPGEIIEHSARIGAKIFTLVSWAGVLYAATNIHSLKDAVVVGESIGLSWGASVAGKALTGSAGVAFILPILLGMSSDQGPAREERERKAWIVEQFLEKNFTREEIAKNSYILRLQAENLLFNTKPLIIEPPMPGMYGGQGIGGGE